MQQDKISDLPELPAPDATDIIEITDVSASASKHVKVENLVKGFADNSIDGVKLEDDSVEPAKINFDAFNSSTVSSWTVSKDGRTASRRFTTSGLPAFGGAGSGGWTSLVSLTPFPSGFSLSNCHASVARVVNSSSETRIVAAIDAPANSIRMSNLTTTTIGDSTAVWINDVTLTKTD